MIKKRKSSGIWPAFVDLFSALALMMMMIFLLQSQRLKNNQNQTENKLIQVIYKDENKELRSILEACTIHNQKIMYSEDCKIKIELFEAKLNKNKSSTK